MTLNDPSSCHLGFGFFGFLLNVQPMYTVVKVDVAMAPCWTIPWVGGDSFTSTEVKFCKWYVWTCWSYDFQLGHPFIVHVDSLYILRTCFHQHISLWKIARSFTACFETTFKHKACMPASRDKRKVAKVWGVQKFWNYTTIINHDATISSSLHIFLEEYVCRNACMYVCTYQCTIYTMMLPRVTVVKKVNRDPLLRKCNTEGGDCYWLKGSIPTYTHKTFINAYTAVIYCIHTCTTTEYKNIIKSWKVKIPPTYATSIQVGALVDSVSYGEKLEAQDTCAWQTSAHS